MSIRSTVLAAAAMASTVAGTTASADVVASWGGNYLSINNSTAAFTGQTLLSGLDRDGDGGNDDNGFGVAFQSPTTGTSIAPTTGNYPTSGAGYTAGPAIFGGYELIAYDTAAPGEQNKNGVSDPATTSSSSDPDILTIRGRYNSDHNAAVDGGEIAGVLLLQTNAPATFGVGSTVDLSVSIADGGLTGRVVFQSDGAFYISADTFAYASASNIAWTWDAGEEFYAYDPATALNFDQANPGVAFTGALSNVTAVGFYFENDNITAADFSNTFNADAKLEVSSFSASAVPEPASVALLGMGLLVMVRRRGDAC